MTATTDKLIEAIRSTEAKLKMQLKQLELACRAERKGMKSSIPRRLHKQEVHAHSVIKPDGTLIGCVMSATGAEKYATNHGGRVTRVVLKATTGEHHG